MAEHDIINNNVIISTAGGTTRTVALPAHPAHAHGGSPAGSGPPGNGDEELTSLSWLQDKNLLKGNDRIIIIGKEKPKK